MFVRVYGDKAKTLDEAIRERKLIITAITSEWIEGHPVATFLITIK
jgi:hypothetical protein